MHPDGFVSLHQSVNVGVCHPINTMSGKYYDISSQEPLVHSRGSVQRPTEDRRWGSMTQIFRNTLQPNDRCCSMFSFAAPKGKLGCILSNQHHIGRIVDISSRVPLILSPDSIQTPTKLSMAGGGDAEFYGTALPPDVLCSPMVSLRSSRA